MKQMIVFVASIFVAHLFLGIQRLAGINWDFHPDAIAYIYDYELYIGELQNIPNNLYFFVSWALAGEVWLIIELNIIAYALANTFGWRYLNKGSKEIGLNRRQTTLLLFIFLCQPYRLHLAVHVLKDTLIFLFLILAISSPTLGKRTFAIAVMMAFRLPSIIYLVTQLNRRFITSILIAFFAAIFFQNQEILEFIINRNDVDMGGRDFNNVPNFDSYGLWGGSLRGLIWPVILISGVFWIFSPVMIFLPIAIEMLMGRILMTWSVRLAVPWVSVFASLGLIAVIVNSFTAFLRYAYPLVCLLPIMAIQMKRKKV